MLALCLCYLVYMSTVLPPPNHFLSPLPATLCPLSDPNLQHIHLNLRSSLHHASFLTWKARCVLCPGQQQAVVGLGQIQCNPANTGVGWPYPAQAAVHFRNVLPLPGWTAAAHLYGLFGFGEKFSTCLWHSGTNTPATQEHYEAKVESLYQGQVQGHYLYNAIDSTEMVEMRFPQKCFIQLWIAKNLNCILQWTLIDGERRFCSGALQPYIQNLLIGAFSWHTDPPHRAFECVCMCPYSWVHVQSALKLL